MIDRSNFAELSEELIAAFGQMADGAQEHPERVSSFYITADAANLVLAALVSIRADVAKRRLPAIAFMNPAGHA